ncbi:MAG: hypothetical protein AVDCRST_MAG22-3394, partial [uncultured Rubrobacteraceae bacterium]
VPYRWPRAALARGGLPYLLVHALAGADHESRARALALYRQRRDRDRLLRTAGYRAQRRGLRAVHPENLARRGGRGERGGVHIPLPVVRLYRSGFPDAGLLAQVPGQGVLGDDPEHRRAGHCGLLPALRDAPRHPPARERAADM